MLHCYLVTLILYNVCYFFIAMHKFVNRKRKKCDNLMLLMILGDVAASIFVQLRVQ